MERAMDDRTAPRTEQQQTPAPPSAGAGPLSLPYFLTRDAPLRSFLRRHHRKLWWVHTSYALGLGVFVALFAQKGFSHARWLVVSLGAVWLLLALFFRFFGSGERERRFATAESRARLRFLVMTYVMKNLYQGMLFFLLPFYWKSATLDSPNAGFLALLGACAVVSTLDLVFDQLLMRWKWLASVFYAVTLFGCMNLVIPALVQSTRTIWTLVGAAAITVVAFWAMHVPLSALRSKLHAGLFACCIAAGAVGAYVGRVVVPPVPMYVASAAVGPAVLPDGRLTMEVTSLHESVITQLQAVTDVVMPGGKGDRLQHVWRRDGVPLHHSPEHLSRIEGAAGAVRLRSSLTGKQLPPKLAGRWTLDVETEDGQLVGRLPFVVTD
jgi:hypothetical protein